MRLLVTGGCGFIGGNFIRMILRARSDVVVCNMDKLSYAGNTAHMQDMERAYPGRYFFERADIADAAAAREILRTHKIEALVNFAAESHVDRSIEDATPFLRSNVQGVVVLLKAALDAGIKRFVQISTDEVYGSLPLEAKDASFREDSPLSPNSPYAASKASADLFCRSFFKTYDLPLVITRCSNNYGPYQFPEKLIPLMFFRAMRGESLPLYGDGLNVRDWIHVEDHCRGVLLALEKGRAGAIYNFGGGAERGNLHVVREILKFCGRDESLIRPVKDRPGHDRRYAMDYGLAARELGFSPSCCFEEGLRRTLVWYRENQAWVDDVASGDYLSDIRKRYGE
ncbi:MAG: dTDP-glucose 4,6-dehydratase [Desulfovibrio sp.]|jgi:dTDP-glucose 4,6-dehydratase|nr:dTDP-glucose 4,6-dehydratase [Desulfovibrio sp.]